MCVAMHVVYVHYLWGHMHVCRYTHTHTCVSGGKRETLGSFLGASYLVLEQDLSLNLNQLD